MLSASLIEPLWVQFSELIGTADRHDFDPLPPMGCHRRRVCDRVVYDCVIAAWCGSGCERCSAARTAPSGAACMSGRPVRDRAAPHRRPAQQWCHDCVRPCGRVGFGGLCPSCNEPVAVDDSTSVTMTSRHKAGRTHPPRNPGRFRVDRAAGSGMSSSWSPPARGRMPG